MAVGSFLTLAFNLLFQVVPRSFIGPLLLATLSWPFKVILEIANLPLVWMQYVGKFDENADERGQQ